jgi:hypothetical protein
VNKKILIPIAAVLLVAPVAAYVASPYIAAYSIKEAVVKGDTAKLARSVDFPRVRESLTIQFNQALMNDSEIQNSPFSGFVMAIGQSVVKNTLESYVTPTGITQMIQNRFPEQGEAKFTGTTEFDYVSNDVFQVTRASASDQDQLIVVTFERRGFFDWVVVDMQSPSFSTMPN